MKRLTSLMIALSLILTILCGASAAGVSFTTAYFTLTLPDGWETDMEDLEQQEGEQLLGYFGETSDVGLVAAAYLVYYEEMKDIALWNYSEAELQGYVADLMEDYADQHPEWIGTVKAGNIPFVLLKCVDEDGEYLYADTMTNGYAIEIEAYVTDEEGEKSFPVTEEYIEKLKNILATFQPVT